MSNPRFCEGLQRMQSDPRCENLDLASCLKEPHQRFADYPEMLKKVMSYLVVNDEEMLRAKKAYETIEPVSDVQLTCFGYFNLITHKIHSALSGI